MLEEMETNPNGKAENSKKSSTKLNYQTARLTTNQMKWKMEKNEESGKWFPSAFFVCSFFNEVEIETNTSAPLLTQS